jgi:F-type H+-transporting ATPase subunit b
MRIRRLLLGALLAVVSVVTFAGPAHAAGPESGKKLFECVEKAVDKYGKDVKAGDVEGFENAIEDCRKAASLLIPALPEIIWGGLAFVIVLGVLMKFAFPALKKGLKAREDKIREDLEAASRAREEAETESAQYRSAIGDARSEANTILEEARADAERVRRDVVARAESEAAEIRARAQEDIRLAQERAMADLRAQVADLSIGLAEKVVERNLDPETQRALIDSYIDSVGSGSR